MLGVTPSRAVKALERTRQTFDEVDALLADGRRYLLGDSLSFADITFASLAALAVLPPEYAGRSLEGRRLFVEDLDPDWRAEVEAFRRRPAGRFVLRLYREERLGPAA
jgi:glutathione S-transferase